MSVFLFSHSLSIILCSSKVYDSFNRFTSGSRWVEFVASTDLFTRRISSVILHPDPILIMRCGWITVRGLLLRRIFVLLMNVILCSITSICLTMILIPILSLLLDAINQGITIHPFSSVQRPSSRITHYATIPT